MLVRYVTFWLIWHLPWVSPCSLHRCVFCVFVYHASYIFVLMWVLFLCLGNLRLVVRSTIMAGCRVIGVALGAGYISQTGSFCSDIDSSGPIRSQFCTCHDSSAVMACAKLRPGLIITVYVRTIWFMTKFGLWTDKQFVKWIPVHE